jgi:hypothetical protein
MMLVFKDFALTKEIIHESTVTPQVVHNDRST